MLKQRLAIPAALCYSLVLLTLSLVNLGDITHGVPKNSDKIFHFLAYCLLLLVWYLGAFWGLNWPKRKALMSAALFSVTFGFLIEILQGTLTETRQFDMLDVLANTSGIILTILVLVFKQKTNHKKI